MFFGRLVRIIFISLILFVLTVNIYYWSIAITQGTEDTFKYVGFYSFFKNFDNMPKFEMFVDSLKFFVNLTSDWSGWRGALAVITLGLSTIAEFCIYLTQAIICILIDIIRIFIWLFGFLGVQVDSSPILNG